MRDASTKQRPFPHAGFCCPVRSSGTTAASDAHPAPRPLPGITGYRTRSLRRSLRSIAGPGRASLVPIATFSTFHAPYAGRFIRAAIQALHPSMAFAVNAAARLLLTPRKRRAPNDAAGFA
jgi:hypothetical protein